MGFSMFFLGMMMGISLMWIFFGGIHAKKNGTFDTCVENSWKMIDYMWKIDGEKMENRWDIYYKYY